MGRAISALTVMLLLLALVGCRSDGSWTSRGSGAPASQAAWPDITIGMPRERVTGLLGEPSDTDILVKQTEAI
jgi:hypothetical protein